MILIDLNRSVVFDDVWTELNKEYSMKEGAFEVYQRVFNQLKELTPGINHDNHRLIVARVEDKFESGTFIFGVSGMKPGDKDHYELELSPWKEWLSFEVIGKCIEVYGTAKFTSWDEVSKNIGYIQNRTGEERELQQKQFERIIAENNLVYKILLS